MLAITIDNISPNTTMIHKLNLYVAEAADRRLFLN